MEINHLEIGNLCTIEGGKDDVKKAVLAYKENGWRLPTRQEFFAMYAENERAIKNHITNHSFFVTNEDNTEYYIIQMHYGIPRTYSGDGKVNSILYVRYLGETSQKERDRIAWYGKTVNDRLRELFDSHNIDNLDLYAYSNEGVEIPNHIVMIDECDNNAIDVIAISRDDANTDRDFAIYDSYGIEIFIAGMAVEYQLEVLSAVEDVFNKIDAGKFGIKEAILEDYGVYTTSVKAE